MFARVKQQNACKPRKAARIKKSMKPRKNTRNMTRSCALESKKEVGVDVQICVDEAQESNPNLGRPFI